MVKYLLRNSLHSVLNRDASLGGIVSGGAATCVFTFVLSSTFSELIARNAAIVEALIAIVEPFGVLMHHHQLQGMSPGMRSGTPVQLPQLHAFHFGYNVFTNIGLFAAMANNN